MLLHGNVVDIHNSMIRIHTVGAASSDDLWVKPISIYQGNIHNIHNYKHY